MCGWSGKMLLIFRPQLFLPSSTTGWKKVVLQSWVTRTIQPFPRTTSHIFRGHKVFHGASSVSGREKRQRRKGEEKKRDLAIHSSLQESGFLVFQHSSLLAEPDSGPTAESSHCRRQLSCTVVSLHLCQLGLLLSFITSAINKALSSKHSI